jgi:SAM-dependent methyltransferase
MMTILFIVMVIVLACFAGVLLKGAPYLPTLKTQGNTALDLLDLRPGQTLLELGSGDGTVLKLAAQRGIRSVGIELNPILVIVSKIRLRKYGSLVEVRWGNFWKKPWPKADGVFVFLLDKYMLRLDAHMSQYGANLASIAFAVPGKKPTKTMNGVLLYDYSASTARRQ